MKDVSADQSAGCRRCCVSTLTNSDPEEAWFVTFCAVTHESSLRAEAGSLTRLCLTVNKHSDVFLCDRRHDVTL